MAFKNILSDVRATFPNAKVPEVAFEQTETVEAAQRSSVSLRTGDVGYQNLSENFSVPCRVYAQQYSQLYYCRLQQLKPLLLKRCAFLWPDVEIVQGIQNLSSEAKECVLIGILYKDMKLKPSILQAYMDALNVEGPTHSYLSDTDRLYLEDEVARIALTNAGTPSQRLPIDRLVTGLVIGCKGIRSSSGEFSVTDWTLPHVVQPLPVPLEVRRQKRLAFVSDLQIGSPKTNYESLLRLRDFLIGALSDTETAASLSRSIVRLVVMGTTINSAADAAPDMSGKTLSAVQKTASIPPLKTLEEVDHYFSQIACSLPVDLVPGSNDPTSLSLPQHPIHPALLPQCHKLAMFHSVTNPYAFSICGVRFLGSSGQAVTDVMQFSNIDSPIDALQLTAEAQYLCPTAPDTLPCYPFTDVDPFCVPCNPAAAPHVLFSGGHDCFSVRYYQASSEKASSPWSPSKPQTENVTPLLLCVPAFSRNNCLVLLDLESYDVDLVKL